MTPRQEKTIREHVQMEFALKVIANYVNADCNDNMKISLIKTQLEEIKAQLDRELLKGE